MSVDGPVRSETNTGSNTPASETATPQEGYLAGCKALDSLEKFITSTESFFHPSNTGHWTLAVRGNPPPVHNIGLITISCS